VGSRNRAGVHRGQSGGGQTSRKRLSLEPARGGEGMIQAAVGDHMAGVGSTLAVTGEVNDHGYKSGFLNGISAKMTAGI